MLTKCPSCAHEVSPNAKSCPSCGAPVAATLRRAARRAWWRRRDKVRLLVWGTLAAIPVVVALVILLFGRWEGHEPILVWPGSRSR